MQIDQKESERDGTRLQDDKLDTVMHNVTLMQTLQMQLGQ